MTSPLSGSDRRIGLGGTEEPPPAPPASAGGEPPDAESSPPRLRGGAGGGSSVPPKPILRSEPDKGLVIVDADTQITGIPRAAWDYRLGNRAAIDWVLDQHKEKKPRDPTIAAKFNTYRFADHKEAMIGLLAKVVRVSVETVAITEAMRALPREAAADEKRDDAA